MKPFVTPGRSPRIRTIYRLIFRTHPVLILLSLMVNHGYVRGQNLLNSPETIVYDSLNDRYLVSNMSSTYITQIDHTGNYTVFTSAVYRPYGMTIVGNTLYVGADRGARGGIFGFDLTTADEVFSLLSTNWYWSINGVTADTSGNLYFACTGESRIYKVRLSDRSYSVLVDGAVSLPNAVYYDARLNRLLATSNVWWTPVYAIDLSTGGVSPVTTFTGQFSGIAEDMQHNYYIAFFAQNNVYRLDSTLSGEPQLIATGQAGPEGICFDRLHSTLCVPNLLANSVSFIPLDIDIWLDSDTTHGWAPMEVNFVGSSAFDIDEWHWDFGDGGTAAIPSPTHTFEIPGLYDITMQAVTTTGDTLVRVYPRYVYNLADTVWSDDVVAGHGSDLEVIIHVRNSAPLLQMEIPIQYSGDYHLVYDSFSTAGCRTESFGYRQVIHSDVSSGCLTIRLRPRTGSPLYMEAGAGPVLKLYFHAFGLPGETATIALGGYGPDRIPRFVAETIEYAPATRDGVVTCPFLCGDAAGDGTVNVADAIYLITYIFKEGFAPQPMAAGDANCDGLVNIGDAVYLVNFVFRSGPAPCCP